MEKLMDPFFWAFCVIGMVWLYRARRSLQVLDVIPMVSPIPPSQASSKSDWVTVIIPVKNEELNITECLQHFKRQNYPKLQILIANDQSTDRTESILQAEGVPLVSKASDAMLDSNDPQIAYFNVSKTPDGWTGKNFAIHSALPFTRGEWLLFTDADTRHDESSVTSALNHACGRDLEFLSLLPRCIAKTFFEKMIQPCAMGFLGLWFPMELVNQPRSKTYFANGQYLLIHRPLYKKIGGHEIVKHEFLEDFGLMKKAKESGARAECAFGVKIYGTRMYTNFSGIWQGWRRIYLHAFEQNATRLLFKLFSVLMFSVFPFALFIPLTLLAVQDSMVYGFSWGFGAAILIFIFIPVWKTFEILRSNRAFSLLHPLAGLFLSMILMDAFWMAVTKQKTTWR